MNLAVEMEGVRKTFVYGWPRRKRKDALRDIDLSVPQGSLWGILGPNGAGKTTLLSILANLLVAEEGRVRVLGEDLRTGAAAIRRRINLSSGHANFPWSMTIRENLHYYAMLYGIPREKRRRRIDELMDLIGLREFARVTFDGLSTGTKQKLSLAKALLNDPELLFLDEPTVGLDPDVAHRVWESIQSIHREKGTTILMTTHNMREAERLCEKIAFIKDGTIKAFGGPRELKERLRLADTIAITFDGVVSAALLKGVEGVYGFESGEGSCRILVDDHRRRLPLILDAFVGKGVPIRNIDMKESDLEDVFIALAG